ncbi:hypothetical protein AnigIFM63309_010236, partial [Aspergillus niger]
MPKKVVPEHHTLSDDSSSIYGSSGDEQSDGLYDVSPHEVVEDFHQCYICGFAFYSRIYSNDRYTNDVGDYHHDRLRGGIYKAFKVENMDIDDTERKKTIRPIIPVRGKDQSQILEDYDDDEDEYRVSTEWIGYPVHARCWELLTHHQLGFIAEKDLEDVMQAMRKRHDQKMWKRVFALPDEWTD